MNFLFSNAWFLWLAPLAALPVLFHMFARIRKKAMPFSTFMFFHRIDPRLNAMRRLREWLLLLFRVLAILLFLLALARPLWLGSGGGGRTAAVIVLDNSGSMGGFAGGNQSKFQRAVEGAEAVAGSLGSGDSAGLILLVDDPSVPLPEGLTTDRIALKLALRQATLTEASGRPGEALQKGFALLEKAQATRFEVHVFTDVQETEWGRDAGGMRPPRGGTSVYVHRLRTDRQREANVSLAGASLPSKRLIAGRPIPAGVRLLNASTAAAEIRLHSEDDQGNKTIESVTVPAKGEKTCNLVMTPEAAGLHWVNAWIEGDSLTADNRAATAYLCADQAAVLFVGPAAGFGLLPMALSPGGDGALSGLFPVFSDTAGWEKELAARKPVMVVTSWDALDDARLAGQMEAYVKAGGNLLVVPAEGRAVPATTPAWMGATPQKEERKAEGLPLLVFQKGLRVFDDLRDAKGDVVFRNMRAFRALPLNVADAKAGIIGLEDGRAVVASIGLGQGVVYASGMAFDPTWSNLPLKGSFLAIAQSMALGAAGGQASVMALQAGERPTLPVAGNTACRARSLSAMQPLDWKGPVSAIPGFARSGIYSLECGTNRLTVAVSSAWKEGAATYVEGKTVPALGGLSCTVEDFDGAERMLAQVRRMRQGIDFFAPFLLACLLALLGEGLLATVPPVKAEVKEQGARAR